ncbi:uncharacterized protein BXZ73DRAFT_54655, partial [Epithele typhae]|uniref:uncharacterized protein n=1 Tax=Epithele typhae TaxID=378194 RepID=UPI002008E096
TSNIRSHMPDLRFNFPGYTIYPAFSVNVGPRTLCVDHLDSLNYPGIPCAVTALGNFLPDFGGHMYLPQLSLYIRFPPGCTIYLSSAALRHGNTQTLEDGRERYSVTQYVSGGVVRYVQANFQKVGPMSDEERYFMDGNPADRWLEQIGRFSTPETLFADRLKLLRKHPRSIITQAV